MCATVQSSVHSFQACDICPDSGIDQNLKADVITCLQKRVFACIIPRLMTRRVCFANDTKIMAFFREIALTAHLINIALHSELIKKALRDETIKDLREDKSNFIHPPSVKMPGKKYEDIQAGLNGPSVRWQRDEDSKLLFVSF